MATAQKINKRRYHAASDFVVYAVSYHRRAEAASVFYRSADQAASAGALRWALLSAKEQDDEKKRIQTERHASDRSSPNSVYVMPNGSRGVYKHSDRWKFMKNINTKREKNRYDLDCEWTFSNDAVPVQLRSFFIFGIDADYADNDMKLNTKRIALVEFTLAGGIRDKFVSDLNAVEHADISATVKNVISLITMREKRSVENLSRPMLFVLKNHLKPAFDFFTQTDRQTASDPQTSGDLVDFSVVQHIGLVDDLELALAGFFGKNMADSSPVSTESGSVSAATCEEVALENARRIMEKFAP